VLHALAGVLGGDEEASESGQLLIDGHPPQLQRGRAGLMQQDPDSQVVLSRVGDDVAFGAENLAVPRDEIWRRVRESLDAVGLNLPLDHPTSALSGGQKQRLGLAGILTMAPGLILLDEPTANLDPDGVLEVRDAVVRTLDRTGATMVVVEHRVAVWAQIATRIVVLEPGGGVMIDGAPAEVLDRARQQLIAAGVWVPGFVPPTRRRRAGSDAETTAMPAHQVDGTLSSPLLLSADDLAVSRRRHRRRHPLVPAASNITAEIRAGRALSITGANGAGKSTLALTLAGLLPAARGAVVASDQLRRGAGSDPFAWNGTELISRIGTVFQEPEHQFVTGNVLDELRFGPQRLGRGEERVEELLQRLRLTHLTEANPFTLSGGEKRRLSVATILAASPQIVVLDEPTFGQDANTWAELAGLLTELLDAGTAIVSVTHDEDFTRVLGGTRLHLDRHGATPVGSRR